MKLIVLAMTLCLMAMTAPSEGKIFDHECYLCIGLGNKLKPTSDVA